MNIKCGSDDINEWSEWSVHLKENPNPVSLWINEHILMDYVTLIWMNGVICEWMHVHGHNEWSGIIVLHKWRYRNKWFVIVLSRINKRYIAVFG